MSWCLINSVIAAELMSYQKRVQKCKRVEPHLFIFSLFLIIVDIHYISFTCAKQQLNIYIPYKVVTTISLITISHHTYLLQLLMTLFHLLVYISVGIRRIAHYFWKLMRDMQSKPISIEMQGLIPTFKAIFMLHARHSTKITSFNLHHSLRYVFFNA